MAPAKDKGSLLEAVEEGQNEIPIVGGPVFGILLGMIFAGLRRPQTVEAGIAFTAKKILQYAIILLGFEMNLFHVLEVGSQPLIFLHKNEAAARFDYVQQPHFFAHFPFSV